MRNDVKNFIFVDKESNGDFVGLLWKLERHDNVRWPPNVCIYIYCLYVIWIGRGASIEENYNRKVGGGKENIGKWERESRSKLHRLKHTVISFIHIYWLMKSGQYVKGYCEQTLTIQVYAALQTLLKNLN